MLYRKGEKQDVQLAANEIAGKMLSLRFVQVKL